MSLLQPSMQGEQHEFWESGGESWSGCQNVASEWERIASLHGEKIAIQDEEGEVTFRELDQSVRLLAARLLEGGVGRGDRVGVSFVKRRHWPLALLALAKLGAIYVPLDRKVPEARLSAMVKDAGMGLVVSDDGRSFGCRGLILDDAWASEPFDEVRDEPVLALLYTSGSTGMPKGVLVEHAGVVNETKAIASLLGLGPGEKMLQFTSPGFDASLEEVFSTLLSGATLVPRIETASEDFEIFEESVTANGVTVLNLPTAFWAAWCGWMQETRRKIPECVKAAVIGGERLGETALNDWMESGGRARKLLNTYGPTEASIAATYEMIDGDWCGVGDPPIGRPLPGYQVKIVNTAGEKLGVDALGELWIGGIGVGPGYWNRDEETAKAFVFENDQRWYRSGDRACWSNEGKLLFRGRIDDQVKIRGHRIEPDEIITQLESHEHVATAYVAAVDDGKALAGWVKWSGGEAPSDWSAGLREYLRDRLASAAIPTKWALVDEFNLTERGKLDRRALPEPFALVSGHYEAPNSGTEEALAAIWCRLLELDKVGRNDDFFELGGSSLLALRLFAAISSELGARLPMSRLIEASKLKDLAVLVEKPAANDVEEGVPVVVPLREDGKSEPLFCVHGGDGGVIFYRELAMRLSEGRPLMTIESPELSVEGAVNGRSVEEMAELYLEAVKSKQPKGPYHLAGYSFGGVMVYEMARQLLEKGEEVAFLGLFDTENPAAKWRSYSFPERLKVFWKANQDFDPLARMGMVFSRLLQGIATNIRVRFEEQAARDAGASDPHSRLRMLQVRMLHEVAINAYVPPPIEASVVLFRTEAVDDKFEVAADYGWSGLVKKLTILDVPGEHLTMFNAENVEDLARRMEEHL